MAKWGEGDPRWIVEERPDATNVNNWHWTEKNATSWSIIRLKELLCNQKISQGCIDVCVNGDFKKIEGEASANNRKAKLIFFYEWSIELQFTVKISGNNEEYSGQIEIPNLSDENDVDEVDISISFTATCPRESEIQHLLRHDLVDCFRNKLTIYVNELKEEFSKGLILPTDGKPQVVVKSKTIPSSTDKSDFQNHVVLSDDKTSDDATSSVDPSTLKSITFKESFKTQPDVLWNVFTDPSMIKKWTNSSVGMDFKPDGKFSLYNGMVTGIFLAIDTMNEIMMKWRLKTYPPNHYATLTFAFQDGQDCTNVSVEIKDVPSMHLEETESGVKRFYLTNIARTFGFGAQIH